MDMKTHTAFCRFELGRTVMTRTVARLSEISDLNPEYFLLLHNLEFWDDMSEEDRNANILAIKNGGRIFSCFKLDKRHFGTEKLYVITEADRSSTTILLPEEY